MSFYEDLDYYDYKDMVTPPNKKPLIVALLVIMAAIGAGVAIYFQQPTPEPIVSVAPIVEPTPEPTPTPEPAPSPSPAPLPDYWPCENFGTLSGHQRAEDAWLVQVLAEPNDGWDILFGGPEWRMMAAECAARRQRLEGK